MNSLDRAISRARLFLLQSQGKDGLWRDFSLEPGESDEWVSGYVGSTLCETNDADAVSSAREAWNVLGWRVLTGKKGWGYNQKAIADADSTVWCLNLGSLLGEGEKIIGLIAKEIVQQHLTPKGGISTYSGRDFSNRSLPAGTLHFHAGWLQAHTCVTAAAARLPWFEKPAVAYLLEQQQETGNWNGYWWYDDEYATGLAVEAIALSPGRNNVNILDKALNWELSRLHSDSFVSNRFFENGSPFATALGSRILLLAGKSIAIEQKLEKVIHWLLHQQLEDGSWKSSAIMRVPAPSITDPGKYPEWELGKKLPWGELFCDQNRLFTTTTVLKTLLLYHLTFHQGSKRAFF